MHPDEPICGAILAGGGSTRMGTDKAVLPLGEQTVLECIINVMEQVCGHVVVNRNKPLTSITSKIEYIHDEYSDAGPLAGLHAVLKNTKEPAVLLSACDTPFIQEDVLRYLLEQRSNQTTAIVPVHEGRIQPLSAIYQGDLLPIIEQLLSDGKRSMRCLLDQIDVQYVSIFPSIPMDRLNDHFFNMNTQGEYEQANTLFRKYQ
ncbi:molybdenum cofactor guanylyltransferase [Halobacillus shinanisalinarum]|uniref:Probable molybdenum cofactor guanylyltransferase n=1 Tax=Halobacillus shinanisalinarum TaxID=2932258 RepID=A0ABY4GZ96_9BACI|nr:molybdenum cofactor guanylyltransferase [Halobacillus shinanisalinarum]UOQ93521.1 molybdenum cofactor guanylyltransferase [Halobacillus shinanisalinarum]